MSDAPARSRVGIVVFVTALVLLVALIVVGVFVQHANQSTAKAGSENHTLAPGSQPSGSSVTPSPNAPSKVLDGMGEEDLSEVLNPVVSDELQPSEAQIWAYEQAYFTVDPKTREKLLKPLATNQYLAEDLNRAPPKYKGIEVRVVLDKSEIVSLTVSNNRFTAYVVTDIFIETVRDGEVVNRFEGPQHASAWVNTEDGWRVIKNVGEQ